MAITKLKEALKKLIPLMSFDYAQESVRQAHHERNQPLTVRPEPVEGLNQSSLRRINSPTLILRVGISINFALTALYVCYPAYCFAKHNSDQQTVADRTKYLTKLPAWTAKDIAVIINDSDPLSVQIGNYYQEKRHVPAKNLLHTRFKLGMKAFSATQFKNIKQQIDQQTPKGVQGYVLTWLLPYRVECMSITTAFAAGFDPAFCAEGCHETRHNPYYDSQSSKPFDDFGWRPTITLAAKGFTAAKELIDRGVAADFSQPKGSAYLLETKDKERSVRALFFPETVAKFRGIFPVHYLEKNLIQDAKDILFYFTGLTHVQKITNNTYLPGAIADHLTSMGGFLSGSSQMSIMEWIQAGATGSYGTVVEPCNFTQKFPMPLVVMDYYLRGNTLMEAYWKSVAEPGQGIFVGEPLAKPFADHPDNLVHGHQTTVRKPRKSRRKA